MATIGHGFTKILLGNPALDGGMSTSLSEKFGNTVPESISITTDEGTKSEIFIAESPIAVASNEVAGAMRVAFRTRNLNPEALQEALGGTVVGTGIAKRWHSPANILALIQSMEIYDKNNNFWAMAKVSLFARLNVLFQQGESGTIDFTGTILLPDKAGLSPVVRGLVV